MQLVPLRAGVLFAGEGVQPVLRRAGQQAVRAAEEAPPHAAAVRVGPDPRGLPQGRQAARRRQGRFSLIHTMSTCFKPLVDAAMSLSPAYNRPRFYASSIRLM